MSSIHSRSSSDHSSGLIQKTIASQKPSQPPNRTQAQTKYTGLLIRNISNHTCNKSGIWSFLWTAGGRLLVGGALCGGRIVFPVLQFIVKLEHECSGAIPEKYQNEAGI